MSVLNAFLKSKNLKVASKIAEPVSKVSSGDSKSTQSSNSKPKQGDTGSIRNFATSDLQAQYQALCDFDLAFSKLEEQQYYEYGLVGKLVFHYKLQQRHADYFVSLTRTARQFRHCVQGFVALRVIFTEQRALAKGKAAPAATELQTYFQDASVLLEIYNQSLQLSASLTNIPRELPSLIKQIAMGFFLPCCYSFLACSCKIYKCLTTLMQSYIPLWRACHTVLNGVSVGSMLVDEIEISQRTNTNAFDAIRDVSHLLGQSWFLPSIKKEEPRTHTQRSNISNILDKYKYKSIKIADPVKVSISAEISKNTNTMITSIRPNEFVPSKVLLAEGSTDEEEEQVVKNTTTVSPSPMLVKPSSSTAPTLKFLAKPVTSIVTTPAVNNTTKIAPVLKFSAPPPKPNNIEVVKKRPSSDNTIAPVKSKKKKTASSSLDDIFGW